MQDEDRLVLRDMAASAVRSHGIDGDDINSDTIDDRVHPDVFADALQMERFADVEAAEVSDVIHEEIAATYWKLVDEANGLV